MSEDKPRGNDQANDDEADKRSEGDLPRTATDMAPGIPTGSGKGIDEALEQPDTDLGGGVAGDTSVGSDRKVKRDRESISRDDRDRTTL